MAGVLLAAFVVAFLYFAPSLIAASRKAPNAGAVFVINLFFGWSVVGWIIALAMAYSSRPAASQTIIVQQGTQYGSPLAPPPPPGQEKKVIVPAGGLKARTVPDPRVAPAHTVQSGVELHLLEQRGAWANVVAHNGRSGWVDARLLMRT